MKKLLIAGTFLISGFANAAIITADFRDAADLPFSHHRSGPVVLQAAGVTVGPGIELNGSSSKSNPSGWSGGIVYSDLNPLTNVLTLTSQDTLDFQTFSASVSNIVFGSASERITGISLLSNNLTNIGLIPTLSFTDNSFLINYSVLDTSPTSQQEFNFTRSTATFQISTQSTAVPEPTTLALLGLGLLGFAASRRKSVK